MKDQPLSRRDFLKLMSLLPPSAFFSRFIEAPDAPLQDPNAKNVLVVVFDTFSAQHISFYGYPRETMPNLARIAARATVYHNHHAGGNWTTPGTASLLTGTYPWTHRAFSERDRISDAGVRQNIFTVFDRYYCLGYSHNSIVNRFLYQFHDELELLEPQKALFAANNLSFDRLFPWDGDMAPISWDRIMARGEKGYTYSLFFAALYEKYHQAAMAGMRKEFPRGIPHTGEDNYFRLEDGIDWLLEQLNKIPRPFAGYFHYLPPHRPYNTRRDFVNYFAHDDLGPYLEKPSHPLFSSGKPQNPKYQAVQRQLYDEFILYVDAEFGRLYDSMQKSGLLDNTWVIFTSDHGEMFERGIFGHNTPVLYEPVVRIPLLVLEPGQTTRRDIYTPTSAVDVLPTLAHITGQPVPSWTEGRVLPPFNDPGSSAENRVFALEASLSKEDQPLNPASLMMIKGDHKLTYYFGYEELKGAGPWFELYDLRNDPQELNNLYSESSKTSQELRDELLAKLKQVDQPYVKR